MKRRNYIIFIAVTLMMVFGVYVNGTQNVKAESIKQATSYTVGTSVNGVLAEGKDKRQYYMFTLESSGAIHLTGSAYMQYIHSYIYDENANKLYDSSDHWNSTSEVIALDKIIYLTSGTYYFCLDSDYTGDYNFILSFESSNETFKEKNGGSNNAINTASTVDVQGTQYNAQLAINDEKDFFKINLPDSGKIDFNATFFKMKNVNWKLYTQSGEQLLSRDEWWNSTTQNITVDEGLYLTSGTYYLAVSVYNSTGKYTFSLNFHSANETFPESSGGSNNAIETASPLLLENGCQGQLALNDDRDFYSFNLSSDQTITISSEMQIERVYIKLYDAQGNEIWSENPWCNSVTQTISFSKATTLNQGNYYLAVLHDGDRFGNYTLKISHLTQENCLHNDCDEEWVDATYFSKGYKKHTCKTCGYVYKTDYQPAKKLPQVYLYNDGTAGKGSVTIYWNSQTDADGYQIRYCRSRNFKRNAITKTVQGASKNSYTIRNISRHKNYYIQVRAYKKSGSRVVYGKWSDKKTFRTK